MQAIFELGQLIGELQSLGQHPHYNRGADLFLGVDRRW